MAIAASTVSPQTHLPMNSLSLSLPSNFPPKHSRLFLFFLSSSRLRPFSSSSPARCRVGEARRKLKDDWLASLSCSPPPPGGVAGDGDGDGGETGRSGSDWVIGIDPDTHGAVALLKGNSSDCSAQVFDSPQLPVLVGTRVRKRLDTKSIVELLRSFDAPLGTTAYIEQSTPYPKDGKQGWWSGGFGYGLWIGVLVALGYSVVPVPSVSWKRKFELSGSSFTKDDSRRVASTLFPSLSSLLERKKDHGRAEALLIAAYGRGMKTESIS